jgi:NADH-quinone oxidoreductase subunit G
VNWEGRVRPFDAVIPQPNGMSDLRVLAALADGLGVDLGFRTAAQAQAELDELGAWEGARGAGPTYAAGQTVSTAPGPRTVMLASWRTHLDGSRALDGEPYLTATAPRPVARVSPATAAAAGLTDQVVVSNDRGSLTWPLVVDPEMIDGVVWVPSRALGLEVPKHLAASAGDLVTIAPTGQELG